MQRMLSRSNSAVFESMTRLSSGMRINSAKDDAAGMQIANRLGAQISGFSVAMRNANDGISMAQIAEGALGSITENLQKIRDLSLQAGNGALSTEDKESLQKEADQLTAEITRINQTTGFGKKALFDRQTDKVIVDKSELAITRTLQSGILRESEKIIEQQLGLLGNGASLKIDLEQVDGASGILASISYLSPSGSNQVFTVDLDDFSDTDSETMQSLKDTALHEMVHAVMANNIDLSTTPTWFVEGTAEAIRGADDRLSSDISSLGVSAIKTGLNSIFTNNSAPTGTSIEIASVYSGGYVAMRYLENSLGSDGIVSLMGALAGGASFDAALNSASSGRYASNAALQTELMNGSTFEDFITHSIDLTNNDNGAFGGLDASSGESREHTLQGLSSSSSLKGFQGEIITGDDDANNADFSPSTNYSADGLSQASLSDFSPRLNRAGGIEHRFQIGADANQTISMILGSFSSDALAIDGVDLVDNASMAIYSIDAALKHVDEQRAGIGAVMNRLDHTVNNLANMQENLSASKSRISDADFAMETAKLAKSQILQQSVMAMMAQSKQSSQLVLQLLG
jgi:flagellin